jgi:hypothetical protein
MVIVGKQKIIAMKLNANWDATANILLEDSIVDQIMGI